MSVDDITDTDRINWLETQMCWIAIDGEFKIKPKWSAGGNYRLSVREACDEGILEAHGK